MVLLAVLGAGRRHHAVVVADRRLHGAAVFELEG
jgi:hypothetical protein